MGLLIRNALVIDCCSPEAFPGDVLVEGGRIASLGQGLRPGPGVRVVDATGCAVLPGLIDCHVHLSLDGSNNPFATLVHEPVEATMARAASNALRNLMAGVTTVRDCGAPGRVDLVLRNAIARGAAVGPRVLASGLCLTITGGHAYQIGREADDVAELVKAVRTEVKAGVDQIKVMATGGVITRGSDPRLAQYTEEELRTVVREAARAGRKVVAHAQAAEGIRACALAGVASVEHGVFLDEATTQLLKDRGVCLVPTLTPSYALLDLFGGEGVPAWILARARELRPRHWASAELAVATGVKVAAGTDAGVTLTPHGMLATEVSLLHERGLGRYEAILSATRWAAELLGLADEVGTLEPGKAADLIVVKGNPLEDLGVLRGPVLVMKGGVVYRDGLTGEPDAWLPC